MSKFFSITSEWLAGVGISAIAYAGLFYFNDWITNSLIYGLGVNWIYLPAGLRLFLTLIFGLPGALGIALASFLISFYGYLPHEFTLCVGVGVISGFAPYLAKIFVFKNLHLESDLSNLNLPKLIACILIYASLSSGLHQLWFSTMGIENTGSVNHFVVMFIGDVIGSLLLISIVKYTLDILKTAKQRAH